MDRKIDSIVNEYAKQVCEAYNPKAVYLFGSYAKGEETKYSDIDIAVVLEQVDTAKYMEIYGQLWFIAAYVDGRIEPKLVIDDGEDDRFSFLHEVKKTGRKVEV